MAQITDPNTSWRIERTNNPRQVQISLVSQPWIDGSECLTWDALYYTQWPELVCEDTISCDWLAEAIEADKGGHKSTAIDIVFDRFDRLLSSKEFDEIDSLIQDIPTDGPSLTFLMAVLSITLPASEYLPSRGEFFERVWQVCIDLKRNPQELLGGLREWSRLDGKSLRGL